MRTEDAADRDVRDQQRLTGVERDRGQDRSPGKDQEE